MATTPLTIPSWSELNPSKDMNWVLAQVYNNFCCTLYVTLCTLISIAMESTNNRGAGQMFPDHVGGRLAFPALTRLTAMHIHSAVPYTLNTAECGHTFCALCLFAATFHDVDEDTWTWTVECPSCKTTVPVPEDVPRSPETFPLIMNPLVDKILDCHVSLLREAADAKLAHVDHPAHRQTRSVPDAVLQWGSDMPAFVALRDRER